MKRRWVFYHMGGEILGSMEAESKKEAIEITRDRWKKFGSARGRIVLIETIPPMDAYEAALLDMQEGAVQCAVQWPWVNDGDVPPQPPPPPTRDPDDTSYFNP